MTNELKRETKGRTRLILSKLDSRRRRADGKWVAYAVDVHYLSESGGVQGNDYGLFTLREIAPALKGASLFDTVELQ